jgi:uncharacterized Zn finger protein (UPF0148 family)
MRTITVKYTGECKKCGATLDAGTTAAYEKSMGIFCPGCEPTDTEDIRAYRQEKADRKADRYEGWADKRKTTANATLEYHQQHYRNDHAFNTQPGHIPLRARINAADGRAFESLQVADKMQAKADSLRHVRVAGDAEKRHQAKRDAVLEWLRVGMDVDTIIYGRGVVQKINKKTATIGNTGTSGTYKVNVDLSFLRQ